VSFDACVRVAEYVAGALRDENDDVRLLELRPDEPRVTVLRFWCRRDEALRIEIVVHTHEQRAKSTDGGEVCVRRWSDGDGRSVGWVYAPRCSHLHHRSTCAISFGA